MQVGIIGVGTMGQHFARRLLSAGHELVVYDASPDALEPLVSLGATIALSAVDLASKTPNVLLCLPTPAAVESVAREVTTGSTVQRVVDLSTTGPSVTKQVSAALADKGIGLVSAPVSGGPGGAKQGTLAMMAAGDEGAFKHLEPVLQTLAENIFFLGSDPSLSQTMKIINNTLYATSMLASCEALVYGVKAGLDPQAMLDVINVSSGRSYATMERIPQCVLDRRFPVRFTTELLHKDVKLCLEEAEKLGSPMWINQTARQFLAFAIAQGDGAADNVFPIRHFEQWAGVQVGEAANQG